MTIPYKTGRIDNPLQKPIKQGFGHFQAIHWNSETRLGYSNIQCPIPICVVNTPAFLHHFSRLANGLSKHGVYIPVYRYTPKEQFYCTLVSWEAHIIIIIINWNWVYHGLPNVLTNSLLSFETHTGTFSFLLLLNKWDPQVALFPDSADGQSLESLDPYLETPPDGFCHFFAPEDVYHVYPQDLLDRKGDDMLFQNQSNITWNRLSMIIRLISRKSSAQLCFFSSKSCSPTEGSTGSTVSVFIGFLGNESLLSPRQRRLQYLTVQAAEARANLLRRVTVSKCVDFPAYHKITL